MLTTTGYITNKDVQLTEPNHSFGENQKNQSEPI